ncbi:hypothetical protein V2J09_011790 [Rumex salicifolius]
MDKTQGDLNRDGGQCKSCDQRLADYLLGSERIAFKLAEIAFLLNKLGMVVLAVKPALVFDGSTLRDQDQERDNGQVMAAEAGFVVNTVVGGELIHKEGNGGRVNGGGCAEDCGEGKRK